MRAAAEDNEVWTKEGKHRGSIDAPLNKQTANTTPARRHNGGGELWSSGLNGGITAVSAGAKYEEKTEMHEMSRNSNSNHKTRY